MASNADKTAPGASSPWYMQYQDDVQKNWQTLGFEALVHLAVVYFGTQSDLGRRVGAFVPGGDLVRMGFWLLVGAVSAEWIRLGTGFPSLPCTAAVAAAPKPTA